MAQIAFDIPDDIAEQLDPDLDHLVGEFRLDLAARMYESGRLSSGQAARLAGIGRVRFLLTLHKRGVVAVDLRPEELDAELEWARR